MRKYFALALLLALTLSLVFSIGALAAPKTTPLPTPTPTPTPRIPNGPYIEDEQNISLSSFMTNAELATHLEGIAGSSKGKMTLEIAGYSDAPVNDLMSPVGYPLYVMKMGEYAPGKNKVLITTQIHGNEQVSTEAILDMLQKFKSGGKEIEAILEKNVIWIMPRINPDGSDYQVDGEWFPVRQSLQVFDPEDYGMPVGTKAPWYYAVRELGSQIMLGYDQNRDYNPNLDFSYEDLTPEEFAAALNDPVLNDDLKGGFYVTPEARIVTSVYKDLQPDVYIDVHHRGFNMLSAEDNRSVPIQLAAVVAEPYTCPYTGQTYSMDADVLKLGKQVNAVAYESLQRGNSPYGAIQKYRDSNLPGTCLGSFALNDTAIMLIEIKGQSNAATNRSSLGQKQSGMLKQTVTVPLWAVLNGLTDGSIYDVDPAIYDAIPVSAFGISDPSDNPAPKPTPAP